MIRPPRAWQRIAKPCSPSTISPPNIGNTCGPRTRSKALLPPCGTARSAPRAASRIKRRWRWCSSSSMRRRKAGAGSMATISCPSSFKGSDSPTGSKSPPIRRPRNPKPLPPEPSGRHQNSDIAPANLLNKLPKSQQPKAKRSLQEIWMAETSKDAQAAFAAFIAAYELKYDKAAECLAKDRQALLAFYDFPAEHWKHLRTSNPIESTFATVRHRTIRSKGCLSNKTALAMVFKLVDAAQKSWRRLDGHNQLPKLIQG